MNKQTKIYFIRHGEVDNPTEVVYGRLSGFALSDTGRRQGETIAHLLKVKPIHAIYSSPLTRAVQTATYIRAHFPKLIIYEDERLLEIRSPVDGKPNVMMYERDWNFYTPDLIEEGGETLPDIWKRMNSFIREVLRKHPGKEIVAVSHGDPIMVVRAKHSGSGRLSLPAIRREYIGHASGFVLVFEGKKFKGLQNISLQ